MNCTEFQEWLQETLDGTSRAASIDSQLHLKQCPECRTWQQALERLEFGLEMLPAAVPPLGLSGRIVAQVLSEQRRRSRGRKLVLAGFAIAASLLCFTIGSLLWNAAHIPGKQDSPSHASGTSVSTPVSNASLSEPSHPQNNSFIAFLVRLIAGSPTTGGNDGSDAMAKVGEVLRKVASAPMHPSVRDEIDDVTSDVAHQIRTTADQGKTLLDLVNPLPAQPAGSGSAQPTDPSQPLAGAGQGVQTGLKPVTNSARRAVDLLLREVPTMPEEIH
jgi:hypothetical protein